jgi:dihydrofolate reductase
VLDALSLSQFLLLGLMRELLVMLNCLAPDLSETRILRPDPPTVVVRARTVIRLATANEAHRLPRKDERLTYFGWTTPNEEQFRFHTTLISELGGYLCGRRLYETLLPWETDPSLRENELGAAFADVWCAIPKVVFSHTLDSVQGTARLAEASLAEEIAAALDATDKDVSIGGAGLAAQAIELGLVDELRMFRNPVVVGSGTPFLPPVTDDIALDLIETRTFGSRVIYERYGRARDESE